MSHFNMVQGRFALKFIEQRRANQKYF